VYCLELAGDEDAFAACEARSAASAVDVVAGGLAGDEDAFAACEARSAASAVDVVAGGVATARGIDPDGVRRLAYTHAASELIATTDADIEAAAAALNAAGIDREGSVAVRARDVRSQTGVSTQAAERRLGGVLVDRGFEVDLDDPDHELRVLFAGDDDDGVDDVTQTMTTQTMTVGTTTQTMTTWTTTPAVYSAGWPSRAGGITASDDQRIDPLFSPGVWHHSTRVRS